MEQLSFNFEISFPNNALDQLCLIIVLAQQGRLTEDEKQQAMTELAWHIVKKLHQPICFRRF